MKKSNDQEEERGQARLPNPELISLESFILLGKPFKQNTSKDLGKPHRLGRWVYPRSSASFSSTLTNTAGMLASFCRFKM